MDVQNRGGKRMKDQCKDCIHFYWCYTDDMDFDPDHPTNEKFCIYHQSRTWIR